MIARARELENSDRGQIVLRTAKYLFRKTAEELQLYSKDLEILSSSLSDIQENDEMLAHYSLLTPCLHNGTEECKWWTELGWLSIHFNSYTVKLFRWRGDKRYQSPCTHS